jgi:porphobilinogen synthase
MVAETRLSTDDLIAPLFVREGITEPQPIESMPGVVQHTRESLRAEVAHLVGLGVPGVILFGVPASKDAEGSGAWDDDGIVQVALRDLRDDVGDDIVLIAVLAIREALDDEGFESVAILAYAAKYASALYGPFRDAVDVTIAGGGDRRDYQQDFRNAREAMEEIRFDVDEGADMVMVKPALAYLDVIARARAELDIPLAAYHVSGEYAMIHAAAERGWIDGPAVAFEHITAIRRAGADLILTYFARDLAEVLA